ncbi:LLM class flavin-dependent oxidoreductase [Streptomyces endocoffeicus]|uniref:LLM class flavin-dependent oxidoreductase n=1 Tax=Streptomyces endocoffeicus TaxID=2898945 RepID=UPI0027DBF8C2|nr:LLM class flavin-dependent oxidoreductase [Streptomyces endocoffeicus]
MGDRVLAAVNPTVGYGGMDTIPWQLHTMLDPFVALGVAASVTERALLGTSTLIAPWYSPLLLARSLTGVDVVSGGRLIPGLGTGWSPEEYQGVGVPWKERGARLDECLDVLEAVWTTEPVARYDGRHYAFPAAHIGLKPVQRPRPPVYLSGFAPASQRRAARRAHPGIRPRRPQQPPDRPSRTGLAHRSPAVKAWHHARAVTDRATDPRARAAGLGFDIPEGP